jgi:hypothetical protein
MDCLKGAFPCVNNYCAAGGDILNSANTGVAMKSIFMSLCLVISVAMCNPALALSFNDVCTFEPSQKFPTEGKLWNWLKSGVKGCADEKGVQSDTIVVPRTYWFQDYTPLIIAAVCDFGKTITPVSWNVNGDVTAAVVCSLRR